eukprot:6061674-Alexandrium_andersonii.AAC.1
MPPRPVRSATGPASPMGGRPAGPRQHRLRHPRRPRRPTRPKPAGARSGPRWGQGAAGQRRPTLQPRRPPVARPTVQPHRQGS